MGEHDEQLVFEMGYNKGFKDGIKGSIPKAEVKKFFEEGIKNAGNNVLAIVREDYIHKADYEKRLKADMVAILDEYDLRLYEQYDDTDLIKVKYVRQAIQQKINALKGEEE